MDIGSGSALIETTAGSHSITVPVTLNKSTTVNTASSTSLSVTGSLTVASGLTLSKTGAGTLSVSGGVSGSGNMSVTGGSLNTTNIRVGSLTINGGNVQANSGTSILSSLSLASGSSLDLGSADLLVRNGDSNALGQLVRTWYANGAKNGTGLKGSSAAFMTLAVFPNVGDGSIPYFSSFASQSLQATDVLVKTTYVGDLNLDGRVDGLDFKLAMEGLATASTGWRNGDVNYDGVVDSADITLVKNSLAANLPQLTGFPTDSAGSTAAVPESSLSLLPVMAAATVARRRRR
jgi:hypothetical protein